MNLKRTLWFLLLFGIGNALFAQLNQAACIQDATILAPGNQTILYFCNDDGTPDRVRFRVTPFAQPFAYLVTDDKNEILLVSLNNTIDFDSLPNGSLRVWAFAFKGNILAQPGQNATTAVLADYCYALTQNFIPIRSVIPNGGTVATGNGRSSLFTCADDGNADIITFTTTSTDPLYKFVITDDANRILALADSNRFDFETLRTERVRVWGVSYVGDITARVGDVFTTVDFADDCFDRSNNFIEVLRSKPEAGTVSLTTGETSRTLCAEALQNDQLSFIARNNAPTPYAFVVTNDNGIVLEILNGNTATLSISSPGVCRVYGVSFTGNLTIRVGDNVNTATLSDDCFDLSDNFVRLVKREVDGSTVRLANGGTTGIVCVTEGTSTAVAFANNSASTGSSYSYLITNENNVIVAIATGSSFNFADVSGRNLRVWGVSYSGNLLARVGDNIATAALSNECYDLSDNFVSITRQSVDGAAVSIQAGATNATVCTGDGRPDLLAFRNTSTSVESYIYLITNANGTVVGLISGNQFDFNPLDADTTTLRVYGLSYSGSLRIQTGGNINAGNLASNCFDLSNNFVTVTRTFVDGGTVRLANGGTTAQVCLNSPTASTLAFANTTTANVNYGYLITNNANTILAVSTTNSFNFSALTGNAFRVWGFSYSGALTATAGANAAQAVLSGGCYELSNNFITVTTDVAEGGSISLAGGATTASVCLNDTTTPRFNFVTTSDATTDTYYYVVTNPNGVVVALDTARSFSLNQLPVGTYRVYGLSITGNLQLAVGGNINGANLSSECFEVSSNFITITQANPNGATVRLENDSTRIDLCTNSDSTNLRFENTSTATERYSYIITDTNNIITNILTGNSFNFAGTTSTTLRVYGVSYSGALTAAVGSNLLTGSLSNGCFSRSANFVTLTRQQVNAGTLSLASGGTTAFSCLGDATVQTAVLRNNSTVANDEYRYVITNSNNVIIALQTSDSVNLEQLPAGVYRVYGVSFTGVLNSQLVNNNVTMVAFSNQCFDVSDNFITLTQSTVDGGTVRFANDSTNTSLCTNSDSTRLRFRNTSTAGSSYAYLVTDSNNVVIAIVTDSVFNFSGNTNAAFRVWGVSYTGALTVRAGDNAATATLSNACFELSSNFISVTRRQVDGARIRLQNGDTSAVACLGVAQIGELVFVNNSTATANYTYLVTDTLNRIQAIVNNNRFNFSNLPIGTYRVRGLSYTGNLQAAVNGNLGETLAGGCFDLSDNFITVTQKNVDGGRVALTNGDTTSFVCGSTATPGTLSFNAVNSANASYTFLVTDRNNRIIVVLNGNSISFNGAAIGEYRVWGLSYTGTLQARVGALLDSLALSDECFDLSNNFVAITRQATEGGNIAEAGNRTAYTFCPGNNRPDVLTFSTTGNSSGSYIYILTDANNRFISRLTGNSINFDTLREGSYRVRGLAFSGTLTLQPGAIVTQGTLSNQCFALSNNFISITNQIPNGGNITLEENEPQIFTCPADNNPDFVRFFRQNVVGSNFVFLVTDTSGRIEAIVQQDSFDFERPTEGISRVYGLAYSGTLTARVGDNALTAALSSDCYDLSNNFISVIREIPNGGRVALQNGDSSVFVCNNAGSQIARFDSTGTSRGEYIYVITDSNNIIRNGIAGDEFDFSFLSPPGVYRVWGLAYTGTLIATIGDTVTNVAISDDCFTLSENFVTVIISNPDGGAVTANGSANPVLVCGGGNTPDTIRLANTSPVTAARYTYLITNDSNRVLQILSGSVFDFTGINLDTVRVWGFSYSGNLLVQVGDDAARDTLASGCFDLSDNFVRLIRSNVDGGTIGSSRNTPIIYTCANDRQPDTISFTNNSTAANAQYRYVITNESNVIRGFITGSRFDFETAGRGVSRVWGVSFTGSFTAAFGANITTAALSNGCFNLSDNFITVSRDTVLGGDLTADRETQPFCPSPNVPGVVISTTSELNTGYVFVLTDTTNTVLKIQVNDTIRFDSLPVGNYRVWGLSYAGDVLVRPGDNLLGVTLASSCFEISSGFVPVYRSTVIDGGRVFNTAGGDTLNVCATDTLSDIVVLENNSDAKDANYRYILTDQNNRIILRNIENEIIDFNRAARGIYRIYGVSYTGNFTGVSSDNATTAVLTDSCYQISENFITVDVQTPNPGRVLTADTLSAITLTVGDNTPDVVSFIAIGAEGGAVDYLVTDSANVVVAIIRNDSIDFDTLRPGTYRVRSVGYTGNLLVAVGDTATTERLADGCYALSTSSVRVTLTRTGLQDPTQQRSTPMELTVAPNPATDKLRIQFNWGDTPQATSQLAIFNLIGQRVYETRIPATAGDNQHTLEVSNLPDGLYLLQLRNGEEVQSVRFLKQWQ